jgi:outer membrane receptor protein involved in Fe transport
MPVRTPLVNDELDSDNVSPEVTVTYTPTDDLTLFASYKQAFKSGSFDSVTIKPAGSDLSFADEEVRGYEGGIKTRLFDRALTLNLAAYSYHYRDLQVGTNEISETGAIAIRTVNAATANIYGVDFDTTYKAPALAPLTLSAGVSYNHARYGSFDNAPCYGGQTIAMGCNRILNPVTGRFTAQDLSGRELMRAPEWTANFGVDFEISVSSDLTLALGASTLYTDSYYTNLLLRSDMVQDSFFKTSASIALRGAGNAWEVALIGSNLENEITTGNCVNGNLANGVIFGGQLDGGPVGGPAGVDELACNAEPGRAVWVRLTVSL